ncbi:hypothetical protein Hanom_Chr12g01173741 [Helianthus anomalus]
MIYTYTMNKILKVHMTSSGDSDLSEERDLMTIVSDDEIASAHEVFTSDSESDPEMASDDDDLEDVLALPLPFHDHLIAGHPDGEQFVALIPIHAIPFTAIPAEDLPFVDDLDHDVASPVMIVIDIPSNSDLQSDADSFDIVISSALFAAVLRVYLTGDDDDTMPIAPPSPTRQLPHL